MSDFEQSTTSWQIKLIRWGVAGLGCINIWRVISLAEQSQLLSELGVSFSPLIRLIIDVGWAGLFITLAVLLGFRHQRMSRFVPFVLLGHGFYQLGILFFFAPSPAARQGWLFYLLVYMAVAFLVYWGLKRSPKW